jgi:hypothetical protein
MNAEPDLEIHPLTLFLRSGFAIDREDEGTVIVRKRLS